MAWTSFFHFFYFLQYTRIIIIIIIIGSSLRTPGLNLLWTGLDDVVGFQMGSDVVGFLNGIRRGKTKQRYS